MNTIAKDKSTRISRVKTYKEETSPQILTNGDYEKVMNRINKLIEIPDNKLTEEQAAELNKLAVAAQRYEKSIYKIKPPSTFDGLLEMKMYELKMNQAEMAKKLKVSTAKLSLILSGKQRPDIPLLKAVQEQLGIDGNYLLSVL